VSNFGVVLGVALVAFYGTRWLVGDEAAASLSGVAGVAALLWCWERQYSRENGPE